ncbi:response regulator [Paenibacillus humicus]|uniref:response regulator n=1 Tax=Paenibacillus humicus TaxID=412861 RepID=UPI000FDB326D|nr:response regulator [Paenibacillus humicus]
MTNAIQVLLVDDEKVDLEWLRRRVAASGLPVEIAGTANSGFAALELLEGKPVDLILSDIRMPIMSGVDFARRAREAVPGVKIVFISGYEDFQYAKQALELGASGYLLKPVDDGELLGMLAGQCASIERERQDSRSVTETVTLASQELMLRWLSGDAAPWLEGHLRPSIASALPAQASAALIEVDDIEWKTSQLRAEQRDALMEGIRAHIASFIQRMRMGLLLPGLPGGRTLLLRADGGQQDGSELQQLVDSVAAVFPLTVTIGCGTTVDTWEQLPASYREAEAALSAKWLLGKNRVITEAAVPAGQEAAEVQLDRTVGEMLQAILSYDLVCIDNGLMELFGKHSQLRRSDAYHLIIRMTSKLHADLQAMNENLYELLRWESHEPAMLFQFETVVDVLSWLRKRLFELSELLLVKSRRQNRKLIQAIIAYVDERLEQRVTLKETAARFNFTPNYLGHLFKEETGQTFSELLLERKLARICGLLQDPSLKIYEIADRMGYKNIVYFNRQFKLSTGMSPGEYRKQQQI